MGKELHGGEGGSLKLNENIKIKISPRETKDYRYVVDSANFREDQFFGEGTSYYAFLCHFIWFEIKN